MDICSEAYLTATESLIGLLNSCLSATLPLEASVAMAMKQAAKDLADCEIICGEKAEFAIRELIRSGSLEEIRSRGKTENNPFE